MTRPLCPRRDTPEVSMPRRGLARYPLYAVMPFSTRNNRQTFVCAE